MQSGLHGSEYVVRLEADYIVKEASELIDLALDLDGGSRVLLEEGVVLVYLDFKLVELLL